MKDLTIEQIEAIAALLHEHVQFYGLQGQPANGIVVNTIERCLKTFPLTGAFKSVESEKGKIRCSIGTSGNKRS